MAKEISKTTVVTIGGVDYSSQISQINLGDKFEELDTTCFGDTVRKREAGLGDGDMSITFKPNDDLANLTTIRALGGTEVAITIKASNAAISTSNPEYQFSVLFQPPPINFEAGGLMEVSVTCNLTTVVTTDTTP